MRILTRYLLRAHLGPFLFALTVMTGLLLVNAVARRFEELAGKGLSAGVISEVFLLSVPHILALSLPMAVLIAALFSFSQLTADNEVTALKASGVNLARLVVPLVVAATLVAAGMVWFNDKVLPETNHRLKNLLVDIARKSPTLELREQVINEVHSGDLRTRYFLQATDIDPSTNRLRDVVIYDLSYPGRDRTVYADSGLMAFNRERTDLFLTLHNGWIHETNGDEPAKFSRLFYERQLIRVRGIGNQLERTTYETYRSDREMGLAMLLAEARKNRKELEDVRKEAAAASRDALRQALFPYTENEGQPVDVAEGSGVFVPGDPRTPVFIPRLGRAAAPVSAPEPEPHDPLARRASLQLSTLQSEAEGFQRLTDSFLVEYHKKFSIPFACIVFVLIGAPIAIRFPRGGVGMVIAVSLSIFGIYYMGLIGGENLADRGFLSPFWAMWTPNLVFLAFGIWGLVRVGKESSTTRGGGWDDLREALRGLVRHPLRVARGAR